MTPANQPISIPFVDLRLQHENLRQEIATAISSVVDTSDFILGSAVVDFENAFARFVDARHAIGVGSGLDALRLSLIVLGIGHGDEVILPANTFIATALAVSSVGARPVLVDCSATTYNVDVDRIGTAVTQQTRAIIPVHLLGQPADMHPIMDLANDWELAIVEDACQAHGAQYRGATCGTFGDAGCFSFYPAKNLGGFGDGGAIVTNRDDVADQLRLLRHYGQRDKNHHEVLGTNSRLDTLQAAVLAVKLKHLARWNERRRQHAARYRELLQGVGDLRFQCPLDNSTSVYHLFVVETKHRDALRRYLEECRIQTGIHYPVPIHLLPAYSALGYDEGSFPVAESLARNSLSLPMYPELEDWQIEYVADAIRRAFDRQRM